MREHYAPFQSALSMLERMSDDIDLDVADRESKQPELSACVEKVNRRAPVYTNNCSIDC